MTRQKTIIQKGIAGLGDRLCTLGQCLLWADESKAKMCVDWRDTSWGTGFHDYFSLREGVVALPTDPGVVLPERWAEPSAYKAENGAYIAGDVGAIRREPYDCQKGTWNTFVVLTYSGFRERTVDRLFKSLRMNLGVELQAEKILMTNNLRWGEYDCVHFRNTDKKGDITQKEMIALLISKAPVLLVTDDSTTKALAEKIPGVICPSVLPPKPVKGGAHHVVSVDKPLYNMSACVDMMLAGRAREFTSTCPRSAFSDLINHGRKTGWEGFGGSGRPREPDLKKCLWNQHSQNGEDGVLAEIISRMNIRNGSFFEAGAWDGIHLSNTRRLVGLGWTGVMCEGDKSRIVDLEHNIRHTRGVKILERFLTPENMDLTLAECGLPEDFDVFSLDIDSCDYQCWKGMSRFRPKIVIIEIEPRADSNEDYVQGDGKPSLRGTDYHGTGFGPMVELGISKGYVLAAHIACNLVFVRNDYCEAAGIPTDVDPYSLFNDRWFLNSRVR